MKKEEMKEGGNDVKIRDVVFCGNEKGKGKIEAVESKKRQA